MSDLGVQVLREIRDEVRKTNERLDSTNQRLENLERRHVETEVRLSTELVAIAAAVGELKDVLLEDRRLREQVANHETRISQLETKTG